MPSLENQRQAFEFFLEHFNSQETFSKDDFDPITSWTKSARDTYWSKQFRGFLRPAPGGRFRVSEAFKACASWDAFRELVTQVRAIGAADYNHRTFGNVMVFEFFMPLTNETALRGTLDSLFYKDTILRKLRGCELPELREQIEPASDETDEDYLDRLCTWISKQFVGYSISHVAGRFRGEELCTRLEAAELENTTRYLIDETTAVTRFIFPCEDPDEAERVRWFFDLLFVQSIIEVVNGEDEIWMVESGMQNRLHIWKIDSED